MRNVRTVSKADFLAHIEEMIKVTGHDGTAPRSRQPKVNVRERVATLMKGNEISADEQ